jgi:hypothetical protein
VRGREIACFALVDDILSKQKEEHAFLVEWNNGQWFRDDAPKPWDVVSMCVCQEPVEQFLALGPAGHVNCAGSGDIHDEIIGLPNDGPLTRGPLRKLRSINGIAYAVGMHRQVYRREGREKWVAIDSKMRPLAGEAVAGFESVDGYDPSELYVVGWDGALWLYDGVDWIEIASPTNILLTDVCCAPDGWVYAAGLKGLFIKGRGQQWDVVETPTRLDDVWTIAWFQGAMYVSTYRGVYVLRDGDFDLLDMGDDQPTTYFHLIHSVDRLWSIGAKDVMHFDGRQWRRFD